MNIEKGYEPLAKVLQMALDQSQKGKGRQRHATDKPFMEQPIMNIGRMVGTGYNTGQAMKKAQESSRMEPARAIAELLGAINYLASAVLLIEEQITTVDTTVYVTPEQSAGIKQLLKRRRLDDIALEASLHNKTH